VKTGLKCKISLEKLKMISDIVRPAYTKRGKLKKRQKYIELFDKAFKEYVKYWVNIIKKNIPEFDEKKHSIKIYKIRVSEEADKYIRKILMPMDYLDYSPKIDKNLKDNWCIIENDVLDAKS
jgi:hypothetical protein